MKKKLSIVRPNKERESLLGTGDESNKGFDVSFLRKMDNLKFKFQRNFHPSNVL
jgi:hypothetical protein